MVVRFPVDDVTKVDGVVAEFLLVYAAVVAVLVFVCWARRNYSISARFAGISSILVL